MGKREDVVPDGIIRQPFDQETLFTALDVIGQRSVRKAKAPAFLNRVNDARCIQRPGAKRSCFNSDRRAHFNRNTARNNRHPTKLKMAPVLQRLNALVVNRFACADLNAIVIEVVTLRRRCRVRSSNFVVSERQVALNGNKLNGVLLTRLCNPEQSLFTCLRFDPSPRMMTVIRRSQMHIGDVRVDLRR